MIKKSLMELVKRFFWLIVIAAIGGLPLVIIGGPVVERNPSFNGQLASPSDWYAIAGIAGFVLVLAGIIVFWIFPALIQLGEVIWKSREDANNDLFP